VPAWPLKTAAPPTVLGAGAIVGLQALAGLGFTIALLVSSLSGPPAVGAGNLYAEVGFFLVLALAVGSVAAGLLLGRPWSRTPAAVLQVLLIGVAGYVIGPSGQAVAGVVVGVACLAALVLLFTARARAWAVTETSPPYGG
jgi:hypothetical protein